MKSKDPDEDAGGGLLRVLVTVTTSSVREIQVSREEGVLPLHPVRCYALPRRLLARRAGWDLGCTRQQLVNAPLPSVLDRPANVVGAFIYPTKPCWRTIEVAIFGQIGRCLIGSGNDWRRTEIVHQRHIPVPVRSLRRTVPLDVPKKMTMIAPD